MSELVNKIIRNERVSSEDALYIIQNLKVRKNFLAFLTGPKKKKILQSM